MNKYFKYSSLLFLSCVFGIQWITVAFWEQYCPKDGWACYDVAPLKDVPTATTSPASSSSLWSENASPCSPTDDDIASSTVKDMLSNCKPGKVITSKSGDYRYDDGARQKAIDIANQIILIGSILSVGALVYAAILYTIAAGDDERVKSAKNSLKFGIIGFVVMLISFPLVNAVVNFFYTASGS